MAKKVTFDPVVRVTPSPGLMTDDEEQRYWLTKRDLLRIKEENRSTQQHGRAEENNCRRGLLTCFESYKQKYLQNAGIEAVLIEQERQQNCHNNQQDKVAIAEAYQKISNRGSVEARQRGVMDAYEAKHLTPLQLRRLNSSVPQYLSRPSKVPRRSQYTTGGMAAYHVGFFTNPIHLLFTPYL
jgi:hypothetical protein